MLKKSASAFDLKGKPAKKPLRAKKISFPTPPWLKTPQCDATTRVMAQKRNPCKALYFFTIFLSNHFCILIS